jgi:hypothetical protein
MHARRRGEEGVALIVAMMAMTLMAALGSALILTTMTEAKTAANYAAGIEAFYVADAGIEWMLSTLPDVADWETLVGVRFDGPASGLIASATAAPQLRLLVTVVPGPTPGSVVVRAQASGARDVQRTLEATVTRTAAEPGPANVRLMAWRDLR